MKKFKVIHPFRDMQDKGKAFPSGRVYKVGDPFPATQRNVSEERIAELKGKRNKIGKQLIEKSVDESPTGNADYPWHLGGGHYELSDGSKVRGKDEAEKAEQQIVGD